MVQVIIYVSRIVQMEKRRSDNVATFKERTMNLDEKIVDRELKLETAVRTQ